MAPPTKRFKVSPNSTYPNPTIEISAFVPPKRPVRLTTKELHYNHDDSKIYMKDEPIKRIYRTKITEISDGEFEIGDLVWSQDGESPYWPGMIAADPAKGVFHRVCQDSEEYFFVQYFGREPSIGWNTPDKIIPFRGYNLLAWQLRYYNKSQRNAQREDYSKKTVFESMFNVSRNVWSEWNYAVAEGQAAMKLARPERIDILSFEYKWHSDGLALTKVNECQMWTPKEDVDKQIQARSSAVLRSATLGDCDIEEFIKKKRRSMKRATKSLKATTKRTRRQAKRNLLTIEKTEPEEMRDLRSWEFKSELAQFAQPPFDPENDRGSEYFERAGDAQTRTEMEPEVESTDELGASSDTVSVVEMDSDFKENVGNPMAVMRVKSYEDNSRDTLKVKNRRRAFSAIN